MIRCYLQPHLAPAASIAERNIPLAEKFALLRGLILPGLVAFSVLGSLYLGLATPTEAAGVGCVGAFLSAAVNRRLTWENVTRAVADTTRVTCMLYWLFFGASALIGVYTLAGGTNFMKQTITALPIGPWGILALMMIIWFILGCMIDWIGILLLTAPIFVPIIESLGFNSIWFGVLFCMNMQISYVSPPFGPAVFYLKGVTPPDITIGDIFHSIWPFMALQVVALVTVMSFPQLALWLPSLMIK